MPQEVKTDKPKPNSPLGIVIFILLLAFGIGCLFFFKDLQKKIFKADENRENTTKEQNIDYAVELKKYLDDLSSQINLKDINDNTKTVFSEDELNQVQAKQSFKGYSLSDEYEDINLYTRTGSELSKQDKLLLTYMIKNTPKQLLEIKPIVIIGNTPNEDGNPVFTNDGPYITFKNKAMQRDDSGLINTELETYLEQWGASLTNTYLWDLAYFESLTISQNTNGYNLGNVFTYSRIPSYYALAKGYVLESNGSYINTSNSKESLTPDWLTRRLTDSLSKLMSGQVDSFDEQSLQFETKLLSYKNFDEAISQKFPNVEKYTTIESADFDKLKLQEFQKSYDLVTLSKYYNSDDESIESIKSYLPTELESRGFTNFSSEESDDSTKAVYIYKDLNGELYVEINLVNDKKSIGQGVYITVLRGYTLDN